MYKNVVTLPRNSLADFSPGLCDVSETLTRKGSGIMFRPISHSFSDYLPQWGECVNEFQTKLASVDVLLR